MTCHDRRHCQWWRLDDLAHLRPGDDLPYESGTVVLKVIDHLRRIGGDELIEQVVAASKARAAASREALSRLDA